MTIPKGVTASYISVTIVAFMILFAGCGITPIDTLLNSEAPLMEGIDKVYGRGTLSDVIALLVVIGLLVNFFAFVLFCSQQIQAVAEAGHLPSILAYRHPVHGAPILASIAASTVGIILCMGFSALFDEAQAQNTLVTAALMPAVLGYALVLECIVSIRNIEHKQTPMAPEKGVSAKESYILGLNPELQLRFGYDVAMIRFAQFICLLFVIGLITLATVAADFYYGLIIILVFGVVMFVIMNYWATNFSTLNSLLDDDHNNRMMIDDMPSVRSNYMNVTDENDDEVVVAMHNPVFNQGERYDNRSSRSMSNDKKNGYFELRRQNENNDVRL